MYPSGPEFWSNTVFMAELLIAELLMSMTLKRRRYFALRLAATLAVLFGCSVAFPAIDGALYSSFLFLTLFLLSLGGLYFCFAESLRTVLFCTLAGYAAQHIAYEIFNIIILLMGLGNISTPIDIGSSPFSAFGTLVGGSGGVHMSNPFVYIMYAASYFLTYWSIYRITSPRMRNICDLQLKNGAALIIIAMTVAFDIVISAIIGEYGSRDFNKTYILLLDLTNMFCCILALYQQFSLAKMHRMRDDLDAVNRILEQSEKQYELQKQNIEVINMRFHDLKHQVRKIGKNNEINPDAVHALENAIAEYDTAVKTGNGALDVILTEKSILCRHNNISLSCIADGKQLNFMSETDLYSLFGNILDNAIDAVKGLDEDKKAIGLSVKRVNGFIFINAHNYYGGELAFEGDIPKTTKSGTLHGYGIKSVKMIAERYGGRLKINAADGIFNLDLLFSERSDDA